VGSPEAGVETDAITIRNLTRQRWVFSIEDESGTEVGHLVLGDREDTDDFVAKHAPGGVRDERLVPSPVQALSREEWEALGPHNRRTIRSLVRVGQVDLSGPVPDEPEPEPVAQPAQRSRKAS
jgi:hypothetical protein